MASIDLVCSKITLDIDKSSIHFSKTNGDVQNPSLQNNVVAIVQLDTSAAGKLFTTGTVYTLTIKEKTV